MHGVVSRNDSVCGASVLRAEFRQDLFALFLLSFFLPMNSNALILCRALLTRHDSVLIFLLAFSLFIGTYESYLSRNYVLLLVWQTVFLCFFARLLLSKWSHLPSFVLSVYLSWKSNNNKKRQLIHSYCYTHQPLQLTFLLCLSFVYRPKVSLLSLTRIAHFTSMIFYSRKLKNTNSRVYI